MTAQKKSLRILIFTHEFFPKKAGVSVFVQEVARAATCAGHLVNVFGPGWAGRTSGKFPYSVTRLSPSIWRLSTIWHLIRSRQICRDAVLYLPEKRALQVMMYLQLLNLVKPASLVATLHGSEIYYFDALPHRRLLFARLLKQVDRITVLSRYCQQLLSERFPVPRDKIRVVPGAVRSDFTPVPRDRGSQAEGLVVLTVGRVHPRKGQMSMLAAIYALEDSLKSTTTYRIVGPPVDGAYRQSLENYAVAHGLNVEFLGEVSDWDLSAIYEAADIFAMTSNEHRTSKGLFGWRYHKKSVEGFGLSYLEAAASGLPVLAYRTGGVEDAVKDGETGILVGADDAEGLARALQRLLKDSSLRTRMGEAGRRWAKSFSWDTTTRRLFEDLV